MWSVPILLLAVLALTVPIFHISSRKISVRNYLIMLILIVPISYILNPKSEFMVTIIGFGAIALVNYISTHKKGECLIVASFCVLISFVLDGILSIIYVSIFKIDMNIYLQEFGNSIIYGSIFVVLSFALSIGIRYIIDQRFKVFNIDMPKKQYALIILLLVSSVAVIIYNGNLSKINGLSNNLLLMSNVILLSYFAIILCILMFLIHSANVEQKRKLDLQEFEHNKLELKQLKVYTEELEKMYDQIRLVKHDYDNMLNTMSSLILLRDFDKMKEYYMTFLNPLIGELESNIFKLGNLHNLKVMEVKGLVAIKIIEAWQKKIDSVVEVAEAIEVIPCNLIVYCRIIGIIMDNAIEECEHCEDPYIRSAFVKLDDYILFVIKNKCRPVAPKIGQMIVKDFSTKGKGRGLGLYSLNKMVEENEKISYEIQNADNEFTIVIRVSLDNDAEKEEQDAGHILV